MNFYQHIDQNKQKTWVIMLLFGAFVTLVGYLLSQALGDGSLLPMAMIGSLCGSLGSYFFGDKMVLALSGARKASKKTDFTYFTVTENLCLAAGIPMPALYVIDDSAMNAFATGRDPSHASVAATTGLIARLDRTELEGVIAHELSHIKNYDTRLMMIVSILVGFVALLGDWFLRMSFFGGHKKDEDRNSGQLGMIFFVAGFLLALLSPVIAQLIQLALSRNREFLADASAVGITKYPEGLARALEKLGKDREPLEVANKATAHLYIHSPFHSDSTTKLLGQNTTAWFAQMFSTHPSITERIRKLKEM